MQMREAPVKTEREATQPLAVKAERASTPAKRKLDDRDMKPEELERQEPRPPPFETNGSQRPGSASRPAAGHHSSSPMLPRRKPRHEIPPLWARHYDRQQLKNANFYLRKPTVNHTQVNGKTETPSVVPRPERAESRHVSPEASRANTQAPPPNQVPPAAVAAGPDKPRMLGPWEATIANQAPLDEMCKTVADFLFMTVVNHSELSELHGRFGIQFEIEAKLGALIDRNKTGNMRLQLPIESEAVVAASISDFANFSSSMTEVSFAMSFCWGILRWKDVMLIIRNRLNIKVTMDTSTRWLQKPVRRIPRTRIRRTRASQSTTCISGRRTDSTS